MNQYLESYPQGNDFQQAFCDFMEVYNTINKVLQKKEDLNFDMPDLQNYRKDRENSDSLQQVADEVAQELHKLKKENKESIIQRPMYQIYRPKPVQLSGPLFEQEE